MFRILISLMFAGRYYCNASIIGVSDSPVRSNFTADYSSVLTTPFSASSLSRPIFNSGVHTASSGLDASYSENSILASRQVVHNSNSSSTSTVLENEFSQLPTATRFALQTNRRESVLSQAFDHPNDEIITATDVNPQSFMIKTPERIVEVMPQETAKIVWQKGDIPHQNPSSMNKFILHGKPAEIYGFHETEASAFTNSGQEQLTSLVDSMNQLANQQVGGSKYHQYSATYSSNVYGQDKNVNYDTLNNEIDKPAALKTNGGLSDGDRVRYKVEEELHHKAGDDRHHVEFKAHKSGGGEIMSGKQAPHEYESIYSREAVSQPDVKSHSGDAVMGNILERDIVRQLFKDLDKDSSNRANPTGERQLWNTATFSNTTGRTHGSSRPFSSPNSEFEALKLGHDSYDHDSVQYNPKLAPTPSFNSHENSHFYRPYKLQSVGPKDDVSNSMQSANEYHRLSTALSNQESSLLYGSGGENLAEQVPVESPEKAPYLESLHNIGDPIGRYKYPVDGVTNSLSELDDSGYDREIASLPPNLLSDEVELGFPGSNGYFNYKLPHFHEMNAYAAYQNNRPQNNHLPDTNLNLNGQKHVMQNSISPANLFNKGAQHLSSGEFSVDSGVLHIPNVHQKPHHPYDNNEINNEISYNGFIENAGANELRNTVRKVTSPALGETSVRESQSPGGSDPGFTASEIDDNLKKHSATHHGSSAITENMNTYSTALPQNNAHCLTSVASTISPIPSLQHIPAFYVWCLPSTLPHTSAPSENLKTSQFSTVYPLHQHNRPSGLQQSGIVASSNSQSHVSRNISNNIHQSEVGNINNIRYPSLYHYPGYSLGQNSYQPLFHGDFARAPSTKLLYQSSKSFHDPSHNTPHLSSPQNSQSRQNNPFPAFSALSGGHQLSGNMETLPNIPINTYPSEQSLHHDDRHTVFRQPSLAFDRPQNFPSLKQHSFVPSEKNKAAILNDEVTTVEEIYSKDPVDNYSHEKRHAPPGVKMNYPPFLGQHTIQQAHNDFRRPSYQHSAETKEQMPTSDRMSPSNHHRFQYSMHHGRLSPVPANGMDYSKTSRDSVRVRSFSVPPHDHLRLRRRPQLFYPQHRF